MEDWRSELASPLPSKSKKCWPDERIALLVAGSMSLEVTQFSAATLVPSHRKAASANKQDLRKLDRE
jgi:hypothetical protein